MFKNNIILVNPNFKKPKKQYALQYLNHHTNCIN